MRYYRFLGREGRTTIPLEIRVQLDLEDHELVSFTVEDGAVVIRREHVCDACEGEGESFDDYFDTLSLAEQQAFVTHLAQKILKRNGGMKNGRA